jgi:hypothetical protein
MCALSRFLSYEDALSFKSRVGQLMVKSCRLSPFRRELLLHGRAKKIRGRVSDSSCDNPLDVLVVEHAFFP